MKQTINKHIKVAIVSILTIVSLGTAVIYKSSVVYAAVCPGGGQPPDGDVANCPKTNTTATPADSTTSDLTPLVVTTNTKTKGQCGSGSNVVKTSIDFGCKGDTYPGELNPIIDMAFAFFRFLSAGVGLVVIGSIIVAGIQYTASRGNPQSTQAAIKRITNALIGLLIYIFMFGIANFLVPGGMFL